VARQLRIQIGTREYLAEVDSDSVRVNGHIVAVDSLQLDDSGGLTFVSGPRVFRAVVDEGPRESFLSFHGHSFVFEIETERDLILKQFEGRTRAEHHHAELRASMPGLVVRIAAKAGDTVTKGLPVLILEAMKMENEIRVPADGVIKEISVREGQAVEKGDLLIVMD
jgi:biotin carboxyl carrier protein